MNEVKKMEDKDSNVIIYKVKYKECFLFLEFAIV